MKAIRGPRNPARSQTGPLDDLVGSIKKLGLLQAILVRPSAEGYEVVAGNRRLEVFKKLRIRKIPCHVIQADDKEAFELTLIENLQRESLNPIEEAESFRKYVDDYGYGGVSELARTIGKSQEYVSRRIQLLDLPKSVREELMRRRISSSLAQELLALKGNEAVEVIGLIHDKHLTVRDVRRLVSRNRDERVGNASGLFPDSGSVSTLSDYHTRNIDRIVRKCITVLKISMTKFDELLSTLPEDDWVVRETLFLERSILHKQIDDLINLEKRIIRDSGRLFACSSAKTTKKVPSIKAEHPPASRSQSDRTD